MKLMWDVVVQSSNFEFKSRDVNESSWMSLLRRQNSRQQMC